MPTRPPATPIAERGVLLRDAANDADLIEKLMTHLPSDLEASVIAVLGRTLSTDLRAALGEPLDIVEQFSLVAKESGRPVDEKELTQAIEAALREIGGDSAASVEPVVVKEELEHAQHALVTHWLSLLITAWDLWGRPADGLALDSRTLVPDSGTCPMKEEWVHTVASLNEALASSVALDIERDVPRAIEALVSKVYAEAKHRVVTLPRGFILKRDERGVRLYHQQRENAEKTPARPHA